MRGEIWWALLDKRRPVALLSRNEAYDVRALVIVAPTSTTDHLPKADLESGGAANSESVAFCF